MQVVVGVTASAGEVPELDEPRVALDHAPPEYFADVTEQRQARESASGNRFGFECSARFDSLHAVSAILDRGEHAEAKAIAIDVEVLR